jgi:phosphopantothenoylcysteine decarboxylase / phosphopantothenate---cysteine ligase
VLPLPEGAWATPAEGGARPLSGKRVVITSGPTREPIDPVRYISNHSSGRQGHAIAAAAAAAGAEVTLISGPVSIADPFGVTTIHVETAAEMLAAVEDALPADIFIAAAAVADWRVEGAAAQKMKKDGGAPPALVMAENPDILAAIGQRVSARPTLVVGFAAETEKVVENGRVKLARKGCDLIVANDVGASGATPGGVFGGASNTVHIIDANGVESWPTMGKEQIAERLVATLATRLSRR